KLPRLAGVVDRRALRQDLAGLRLEEVERLVKRHRRRDHALNANGIELLKLLQIARFRRRLQAGKRRQRYETIVRTGDVNLLELTRRQLVGARHLRDDLVAPAVNAESVDVIRADERRQVAPRLTQVHPL